MAELAGYKPIKGDSRRRVVAPNGEIISRRQYQKLQHEGLSPEQVARQAKAAKPKTPEQERRESLGVTQKSDYADKLDVFVSHWNANHPDERISKAEAIRSIEFKAAYAVHARMRARKKPDVSPTGPWARSLVDLGVREPEANWNVGDTPRRSGRR